MSIFDPEYSDMWIRIPSHRRTLGDAARLERDVLLILRDVFPDAGEWIGNGQKDKLVAIDFDDAALFTDTIVKLRQCSPRSHFPDPDSLFYTAESVPNLYTTANGFYTPNPKKRLRPHPNESISWSVTFSLGSSEQFYEHIHIHFPFAISQSREEAAKIERLLERLITLTNPEDARFAIMNFDKPFWKVDHRIGWLTYLSQPLLVTHLHSDPRARPFHHGVILKLSDDPRDMMNDDFVKRSFEFGQTLVPYWPPQLEN